MITRLQPPGLSSWIQLPLPRLWDVDDVVDGAGRSSFSIVGLERRWAVGSRSTPMVGSSCRVGRVTQFNLRARVLVGARVMGDVESVVLVAPSRLLAGLADALVGER